MCIVLVLIAAISIFKITRHCFKEKSRRQLLEYIGFCSNRCHRWNSTDRTEPVTDPETEREQDEQTIAIDFERLLAKYTDVVGGSSIAYENARCGVLGRLNKIGKK